MIRLEIAKHAVISMNYLFLQHAVSDPYVTKDQKLEGELYSFFNSVLALEKCYGDLISRQQAVDFFSENVNTELKEGDYFDRYTPNELKKNIEESIYIIMGTNCPQLSDLYANCIDSVLLAHTS